MSIKISLARLPPETVHIRPRQLLSVCGQLPVGLSLAFSDRLRPKIAKIDDAGQILLRHSLVYTGGVGELRMLSPVRHYVSQHLPMSAETRSVVEDAYVVFSTLINGLFTGLSTIRAGDSETDREVSNALAILSGMVDRPSIWLVRAVTALSDYCTLRGQSCRTLLERLLEHVGHNPEWKAQCLNQLGHHLITGNRDCEEAMGYLQGAADLFADTSDNEREGVTRKLLGELLIQHGRHGKGREQLARARSLLAETDWSHMVDTMNRSGDWQELGEQDLAAQEQTCRVARDARIQAGDIISAAMISNTISDLRAKQGDADGSADELETTHSLAERAMPESGWLASIKDSLAKVYLERGQYERAEDLATSAYTLFSLHDQGIGLASVTNTLALIRGRQLFHQDSSALFRAASVLYRKHGYTEQADKCEVKARLVLQLAELS